LRRRFLRIVVKDAWIGLVEGRAGWLGVGNGVLDVLGKMRLRLVWSWVVHGE
jgi:hypothetical protein